jgi:type III restriction enzyme
MSARMNWDRVRKDSLSRLHGSELVNPFVESSSCSRSKKKNRSKKRKKGNNGKEAPRVASTLDGTLEGKLLSPGTLIVGCTCGKTIEFTSLHKKTCALFRFQASIPHKPLAKTEGDREVVRATVSILKRFVRLGRSNDLKNSESIQKILENVQTATAPAEGVSASVSAHSHLQSVVSKTVELFIDKAIDIPKIVLFRKCNVAVGFQDFDLDLNGVRVRPVISEVVSANFPDRTQYRPEARLEDYVVRGLVDFDDVSYEDHHDLLYKLAAAVVRHLRSYIDNEDDIRNVLQFHQAQIAKIVYSQMQQHHSGDGTEYEASITRGFITLRPESYFVPATESPRDFRFPVDNNRAIGNMLFGGFNKCLSPCQRFRSDTERCFAVLLEDPNDSSIVKWLKPGKDVFHIHFGGTTPYEPDFVIETKKAKLICDISDATSLDHPQGRFFGCAYRTPQ